MRGALLGDSALLNREEVCALDSGMHCSSAQQQCERGMGTRRHACCSCPLVQEREQGQTCAFSWCMHENKLDAGVPQVQAELSVAVAL